MMRIHPKKIIAIGFVLVLFGFLAPFLMVIKVIEASYVLSFLSYGASVGGLLLGLVGAAWYSRLGKS
jgi:hypothetical protein